MRDALVAEESGGDVRKKPGASPLGERVVAIDAVAGQFGGLLGGEREGLPQFSLRAGNAEEALSARVLSALCSGAPSVRR